MRIGSPAPKDYTRRQAEETKQMAGKGPAYATYYGGKKEGEIPERERDRYVYQYDPSTKTYKEFDKQLGDFSYNIRRAEAQGTPASTREIQNLGGGMDGEGDSEREDFLDALAKRKRK